MKKLLLSSPVNWRVFNSAFWIVLSGFLALPGCASNQNYVRSRNSDTDILLDYYMADAKDINDQDESGQTPLMRAAGSQMDYGVVQLLIEAGADIHIRNSDGFTALMLAAFTGGNGDIIDQLIAAGSEVDATENNGWTALSLAAAISNNLDAIDRLLSAGADVNVRDNNGVTPLQLAAQYNEIPRIIHRLIDAGANIFSENIVGQTVWDTIQTNESLANTSAYWRIHDLYHF